MGSKRFTAFVANEAEHGVRVVAVPTYHGKARITVWLDGKVMQTVDDARLMLGTAKQMIVELGRGKRCSHCNGMI